MIMQTHGDEPILGPEVGVPDILDHILETKASTEEEQVKAGNSKRHPLRPSSAGECERALTYKLLEHAGKAYYPKEGIDPDSTRLFSMGYAVEREMMYYLRSAADFFDVKYAQQTLTFFNVEATDAKIRTLVEGSNDGCFVFKNDKYRGVFDIKSKKDKWSASYKSNWEETSGRFAEMRTIVKIRDSKDSWYVSDLPAFLEELNDPFFAANFLQLNFYCESDFMKQRGFTFGSILQYNKNDSRLREIRFKPSRLLYEQVETRFKNAAAAADSGDATKARKEFALGNIKCAFCDYKADCWGADTDALKAWFKTFPKKYWPKEAESLEGSDIAQKLVELESLELLTERYEKLKQEICVELFERKVYKVRVGGIGGKVWELKTLKDRLDLRLGKA